MRTRTVAVVRVGVRLRNDLRALGPDIVASQDERAQVLVALERLRNVLRALGPDPYAIQVQLAVVVLDLRNLLRNQVSHGRICHGRLLGILTEWLSLQ